MHHAMPDGVQRPFCQLGFQHGRHLVHGFAVVGRALPTLTDAFNQPGGGHLIGVGVPHLVLQRGGP